MGRRLFLIIVLSLAACVSQPGESFRVMPIATARTGEVGARVAIEGIVTVKPGAFDPGFALQDATGGIYVSDTRGAALLPGDRVRVEGELALVNAQATVAATNVNRLGAGIVPAPVEVTTGDAGPATEGRLIASRGTMTGAVIDDQPWGWKLYLDDGSGQLLIFVATATGIDLKNLRAGDALRVTGFHGRYAEHTELLPRSAADIVAVSPR